MVQPSLDTTVQNDTVEFGTICSYPEATNVLTLRPKIANAYDTARTSQETDGA